MVETACMVCLKWERAYVCRCSFKMSLFWNVWQNITTVMMAISQRNERIWYNAMQYRSLEETCSPARASFSVAPAMRMTHLIKNITNCLVKLLPGGLESPSFLDHGFLLRFIFDSTEVYSRCIRLWCVCVLNLVNGNAGLLVLPTTAGWERAGRGESGS